MFTGRYKKNVASLHHSLVLPSELRQAFAVVSFRRLTITSMILAIKKTTACGRLCFCNFLTKAANLVVLSVIQTQFVDTQQGQSTWAWAWACSISMGMPHEHGHEHTGTAWTWTWICRMDTARNMDTGM
jgi:hypothetical protein